MSIRQIGKKSREWLKFRKLWLRKNPPDWRGYYRCGICKRLVHESEVELDHIKNRSTHPHLIFDFDNIQPAHGKCNLEKKFKSKKDAKLSARVQIESDTPESGEEI